MCRTVEYDILVRHNHSPLISLILMAFEINMYYSGARKKKFETTFRTAFALWCFGIVPKFKSNEETRRGEKMNCPAR